MDVVERLRLTSANIADHQLMIEAANVIEQLRLAEEGAQEAFGHVVQQKRNLEAECRRLRGLLDGAYDTIRRQTPKHESSSGEINVPSI